MNYGYATATTFLSRGTDIDNVSPLGVVRILRGTDAQLQRKAVVFAGYRHLPGVLAHVFQGK